MLTVECPYCEVAFNFRASSLGKLYRCRNCRGDITFAIGPGEKPPFSHGGHILATILTGGLWLFMGGYPLAWMFHCLKAPPNTIYAKRSVRRR